MMTFNYFDDLCDMLRVQEMSAETFVFMGCLMGNYTRYVARRCLERVLNEMPMIPRGGC